MEQVTVSVLPGSLRREVIYRNHDAPTAGHQGFERTLSRLELEAYWVSMTSDVEKYCRECIQCQQSKQSMPQRAPLANMPIGRPWQMLTVDILEVPLSVNNNRYLLVVQDYFTKWVEAVPIPDQMVTRITCELVKIFSRYGPPQILHSDQGRNFVTCELVKIFSRYGPPQILHSDQGRNFESSILFQTLPAFGIEKLRTTAYHPQGDGMVERFNRTLLQLLRSYVESQSDWERYLPLILYAYRTAAHSSTGVSPFMMMYGRSHSFSQLTHANALTLPPIPATSRPNWPNCRILLSRN